MHACPQCDASVPGRGASLCVQCARSKRIERRIMFNLELLEQDWVRHHFLAFNRTGVNHRATNAIRRLDRYATFFYSIDQSISSPAELTQKRLLADLGMDELRKASVVIQYFVHQAGLEWDRVALEDQIEEARITTLLDSSDGAPWGRDLRQYCTFLAKDKGGGRKPKTVRCYLSAVVQLFSHLRIGGFRELTQKQLDDYLRRNRGSSANLTLFVRYANETWEAGLATRRITRRPQAARDGELIADVRKLMARLSKTTNAREARALLAALISKSYQVSLSLVLSLRREHAQLVDGTVSILIKNGWVELVPDLADPFMKWALPSKSEYLFPGRNGTQPFSESAVWYHMRTQTLSFATAT